MLSTTLLTYCSLLTLSLAAPLSNRQSSTAAGTLQGIYNIDREVRALTATGATTTSIGPVLVGLADIDRVNRDAYRVASSAAPLSWTVEESKAIARAVTNTVAVSIPAGLVIIKASKPKFDAAGYSNSILGFLKVLLDDHDSFSAATAKSLSPTPDVLAEAGAGATKIDLAIRDAVAFYTPATA